MRILEMVHETQAERVLLVFLTLVHAGGEDHVRRHRLFAIVGSPVFPLERETFRDEMLGAKASRPAGVPIGRSLRHRGRYVVKGPLDVRRGVAAGNKTHRPLLVENITKAKPQ